MKILFFLILLLTVYLLFIKDKFTSNKDNLTVVSGYWKVKNKHGHGSFNNWFKNTLSINQRYIFFCDPDDIEFIKQFRKNLETIFIDYPVSKFYTNKFSKDNWVIDGHVPSKELGMIWNEKMYLMKVAKDLDPDPTPFYVWIDSGIPNFRETPPPKERLHLNDINSLPHDKLCYTYIENEKHHSFGGGVLIMHRNIIDSMVKLYYSYLQKCESEFCGVDQHIFTNMLHDYPDLFYKMSTGYGENLNVLYTLI